MSVNPFERCVDTDRACRLDKIAQGDELHYSRVLLQGDEGVEGYRGEHFSCVAPSTSPIVTPTKCTVESTLKRPYDWAQVTAMLTIWPPRDFTLPETAHTNAEVLSLSHMMSVTKLLHPQHGP